jgi:hypothetical protein
MSGNAIGDNKLNQISVTPRLCEKKEKGKK